MTLRKLNKPWIEIHIREALQQLQATLENIGQDRYSEVQLEVELAHAYNHLNTAWNARRESDKSVQKNQGPLFYKWREFPSDIDMGPPGSSA